MDYYKQDYMRDSFKISDFDVWKTDWFLQHSVAEQSNTYLMKLLIDSVLQIELRIEQ